MPPAAVDVLWAFGHGGRSTPDTPFSSGRGRFRSSETASFGDFRSQKSSATSVGGRLGFGFGSTDAESGPESQQGAGEASGFGFGLSLGFGLTQISRFAVLEPRETNFR